MRNEGNRKECVTKGEPLGEIDREKVSGAAGIPFGKLQCSLLPLSRKNALSVREQVKFGIMIFFIFCLRKEKRRKSYEDRF